MTTANPRFLRNSLLRIKFFKLIETD